MMPFSSFPFLHSPAIIGLFSTRAAHVVLVPLVLLCICCFPLQTVSSFSTNMPLTTASCIGSNIIARNRPIRTRPLTSLQYQPFTQVVSDVDDTLKSSGGVNVAGVALGGIDTQYKRGDFYPGVFQFMLELSMYSVELINEAMADVYMPKINPPKVSILTARAEEFKAALELKEDSKLAVAFRKTGEDAGVDGWGLGPVLYGSVAEWVVQDKKGLRKFNSFEQLIRQDPTGSIMQYVWIGDTGELDQEAGETMLREYPEVVKAVFLHVVSETPNPAVPPPKLINGRPLVFFRTYVGAAARATQLGLMGEEGLARVMAAAEDALDAASVPRTSDKWTDIERDMKLAARTLSLE